MCWYTLVILVHWRLRQEDCDFELAWARSEVCLKMKRSWGEGSVSKNTNRPSVKTEVWILPGPTPETETEEPWKKLAS